MIASLFYGLGAAMIAAYAVLDGFDLGAGALHRALARTDGERRQLLAAIGPHWDGNEVFLLATGGIAFVAFPGALASALSGLYLAIMLVLWLLIGRGLGLELRSHVDDPLWCGFWDTVFCLSSLGLALLFGVAIGALVRGFPLDDAGDFQLALFDEWWPGAGSGIVDGYTLSTGAFAVLALSCHGARFVAWKTDGPLEARAARLARALAPVVAVAWMALAALTFAVRPDLPSLLARRPVAWALLALAALGLGAAWRSDGRRAFLGSALFLGALVGAIAATTHPELLHARSGLSRALADSASDEHGLRTALLWVPIALVLAGGYVTMLHRLHRGKVSSPSG